MSVPTPPKLPAPKVFEDALREFKKQLSAKDLAYFEAVNLKDVEETIEKIELEQKAKKRMQNLARIKPFLHAIDQYGKVIEVFLNASMLIAFVWGPIKFLLNVASAYAEAFDTLLSTYEELAEYLPLYTQYESHFHSNPYMYKALGYVYKDFLNFHLRMYKIMKSSKWKEIFSITWSGFQPALQEIRTNLLRHKSLVENQASLLQFEEFRKAYEVAESHFQNIERTERLRQTQELLEWLGMTGNSSPITDHERFTDIWKDYSSSGQWLHNCDGYRKLCDPNADVPAVWLHGIPGSGKTILSSYIIERLREVPQFTVGWFYCRFGNKEKNTLLAVTRGILAQLLGGNDRLRPLMLKARQQTDAAKLVSARLAQELMKQCLEELQKSCVVIDGLDECDREERKKIIEMYTRLAKQLGNNLPTSVRILFVSTNENDIKIQLNKAQAEIIHLTAAENYAEMLDYSRIWSKKIQELHQLSHQETEVVALDVLKRANGMYLFCYLVLYNLLGQLTREDLDRELQPDNLPNGLGDAYDKILRGIDTHPQQAYRLYARKILGWVACAKRALKLYEIQGALCLGTDGQFDMERRRLRVGVKDICGALVEIYSDGTVEFVHLSAREYIIRYRTLQNELGQKELEPWIDIATARFDAALACVQYLSLDCFNTQLTDEQVRNFIQQGFYCLQDYAVAHWYDHIQSCLDMTASADLSKPLQILHSSLVVFLSRRWDESTEQSKGNKKVPAKIAQKLRLLKDPRFQQVFLKLTRFQVACESLPADSRIPFLNFSTQVRRARIFLECEQPQLRFSKLHPLEQYYGPRFSLFKCSRENCLHFAEGFQSLAERDKHELKHERPFTCPEAACLQSSIGFPSQRDLQSHIKSQHSENAHLHRQQDDGYTINEAYSLDDTSVFIVEAAEGGHFQIAQTLVDSGVDVNVRDLEGMTALHRASANGHIDIVRLLAGVADASLLDNRRQTALHVALIAKNLEVVDVLLDIACNMDITGTDVDEKCPLSIAAEMGYVNVVQKLLPHVLDCDKDTKRAKVAVLNASREGHLSIIQALYLHSSRDEPDRYFYDTLLEACVQGHLGATRHLLSVSGTTNPTVQLKLQEMRMLAVENGQTEIVRLLLDLCNGGLEKAELSNLLIVAVYVGNTSVVELLLRECKANHSHDMLVGLDVRILLMYAAQQPKLQDMMQLLLGSSPGRCLDHETIGRVFLAAVLNGHPVAVLDVTAGPTTLGSAFTDLGPKYYTQALEAHVEGTTHAFNPELIRVLVAHGAHVPLVLSGKETWLHHATELGMIEPVRLLTGNDPELGVVVPVNTTNQLDFTPMEIAAIGFQAEILRYLLEELHERFTVATLSKTLELCVDMYRKNAEKSSPAFHLAFDVTIRLLLQYHEVHDSNYVVILAGFLLEGSLNGARERNEEWFIPLMLKCSADITFGIAYLVKCRRTAHVRLLLGEKRQQIDINNHLRMTCFRESFGTLLDYACNKGFLEMVRVFLSHGAKSNGGQALCIAAHYGYARIMKLLLDNGANVNEKPKPWRNSRRLRRPTLLEESTPSTPLHYMIYSERVLKSQELSKSILQILEYPSVGSPGQYHDRIGEEEDVEDYELAVRVLLDHGADSTLQDAQGLSPISILQARVNRVHS